MQAVLNNHIECVKLLPAEVKQQSINDSSALMLAAYNGRVACIPFLLSECSLVDKDGRTALHKVCEYGYAECAALLQEESEVRDRKGKTPLGVALEKQHDECAELIRQYLRPLQEEKAATQAAIRVVFEQISDIRGEIGSIEEEFRRFEQDNHNLLSFIASEAGLE